MSVIGHDDNQEKERLSVAYLTAVAAQAGCQVGNWDIDKQSIDATVSPILGRPVKIDIQLKATSQLTIKDGNITFPLSIKNYDDLRATDLDVPKILIVFDIDALKPNRASFGADTVLRKCGYWTNLFGAKSSPNTTSVSIDIPISNRFDDVTLQQLINSRYAKIQLGQSGI